MVAIIILASLSAIFHDDYHPLDFCNLLLLRFSRNRKNTKNNLFLKKYNLHFTDFEVLLSENWLGSGF